MVGFYSGGKDNTLRIKQVKTGIKKSAIFPDDTLIN
jgi:hypothetical protein